MQATVRSFDPDSRAGTLLADDGVELPYDVTALPEGLRGLRIGQRVQVELTAPDEPGARVRTLHIYTLPY
jgi:cold shock CspA family protein